MLATDQKRYTPKLGAKWLNVSLSLMYALLAAGRIRHERHGLGRGKILIPEDALEEYRKSRTMQADGGKRPFSAVFTH